MKRLSCGLIFCSSYIFLLFSNPVTFLIQDASYQRNIDSTTINAIQINQVSFDDAPYKNEFGYKSGWIELVNTADKDIYLQDGCWSISNDSLNPALYIIRKNIVIAPHGKFLIWCDKLNAVQTDVHTNFKLKSRHGQVSIYHINLKQTYQCVDRKHYNKQERVLSMVR